MSEFGPPAGESDHVVSLRNSSLPARPRAALEALFSVASSNFEQHLQTALTEFEQHLFRLADQARSNETQQQHLDAMRDVRRARADVAPRFLLRLEHALASIDRQVAPPNFVRPRLSASHELSLVDKSSLEEQLALQEIATRAELRYSQLLFLLGQRFGVMAGRQAFETDELPLGPCRVCECLRTAVTCLDLNQDYRIQFYRIADRLLFASAEPLYVLFNEVLIQHRILPHLGFQLPRIRREEAGVDGPGASAKPGPAAVADAPAAEAAANDPDLPPAFRNPMTGWLGAPAASGESRKAGPEATETFENLRSLLAWRRPSEPEQIEGGSAEGATTPEDLDVVLRELQSKPQAPIQIEGRSVPRTLNHLRQDLLNYLRQIGPQGGTPRLAPEDNDALELLGLMFEQLGRDQRPDSSMQQLLGKLQIPIARIALRDKRFFTRPDHPARELLNTVAEAGHYWLDEESDDRNLVERMQNVVDRANFEFESDVRVFEELSGDLSRQIGTMVRKSEVAERRHVEAAKGREKLEAARSAASRAIDERVARHSPPALLRTLLEQAWADVLALTILRHTESSEIYRRRVKTADRLIEVLEKGNAAELPQTPETLALREEVEAGLKQIGYHDADVSALNARLFKDAPGETTDPTSLTELTIRLKSRSRLGVDSTAAGAGLSTAAAGSTLSTSAKPQAAPLTEDEMRARHNLLSLPFGTWFEFTINQQGQTVRRKLAWYSTLSGNCLFVNQRGARTEERTLDQLARELTRGNVTVIEANPQNLLERRWGALVASLKSTTGLGRGPEQPSAASR